MYLAEFEVKNFRCLKYLKIHFRSGLNVILGENNTGKSALIDAIRLVLSRGYGRRDIYPSEEDLHHDEEGKPTSNIFELHATFNGLSPAEQGCFSNCLNLNLGIRVAQIHFRFELVHQSGHSRSRVSVWGGEHEGESIPYDILECIRAVYLEALRDASMDLKPGRNSRVSRLLQLLASDDDKDRESLTEIVRNSQNRIESHDLLKRAKAQINERLLNVTGSFMTQTADLRFSLPEFRRITESLRALIGKEQPFELEENGLGYNNLLYIATVLGELQQAKKVDEIDFPALLIEEPEAHLHPHLQTVLIEVMSKFLCQWEWGSGFLFKVFE